MEGSLRDGAPADLILIETLRWEADHGYVRLPAHLARLAASAAVLGIAHDPAAVAHALGGVAGPDTQRVRLTMTLGGEVAASWTPLAPAKGEWAVTFAEVRLRADDPWLGIKSSRRPLHDRARAALPAGIDEALLLNDRGEVCEGTITTVFADLGEGLVTPPLSSGLLPGVLRAELVAAGAVREALLRPEDLLGARLYVGNSLRGLIPARLQAPEWLRSR